MKKILLISSIIFSSSAISMKHPNDLSFGKFMSDQRELSQNALSKKRENAGLFLTTIKPIEKDAKSVVAFIRNNTNYDSKEVYELILQQKPELYRDMMQHLSEEIQRYFKDTNGGRKQRAIGYQYIPINEDATKMKQYENIFLHMWETAGFLRTYDETTPQVVTKFMEQSFEEMYGRYTITSRQNQRDFSDFIVDFSREIDEPGNFLIQKCLFFELLQSIINDDFGKNFILFQNFVSLFDNPNNPYSSFSNLMFMGLVNSFILNNNNTVYSKDLLEFRKISIPAKFIIKMSKISHLINRQINDDSQLEQLKQVSDEGQLYQLTKSYSTSGTIDYFNPFIDHMSGSYSSLANMGQKYKLANLYPVATLKPTAGLMYPIIVGELNLYVRNPDKHDIFKLAYTIFGFFKYLCNDGYNTKFDSNNGFNHAPIAVHKGYSVFNGYNNTEIDSLLRLFSNTATETGMKYDSNVPIIPINNVPETFLGFLFQSLENDISIYKEFMRLGIREREYGNGIEKAKGELFGKTGKELNSGLNSIYNNPESFEYNVIQNPLHYAELFLNNIIEQIRSKINIKNTMIEIAQNSIDSIYSEAMKADEDFEAKYYREVKNKLQYYRLTVRSLEELTQQKETLTQELETLKQELETLTQPKETRQKQKKGFSKEYQLQQLQRNINSLNKKLEFLSSQEFQTYVKDLLQTQSDDLASKYNQLRDQFINVYNRENPNIKYPIQKFYQELENAKQNRDGYIQKAQEDIQKLEELLRKGETELEKISEAYAERSRPTILPSNTSIEEEDNVPESTSYNDGDLEQ